MLQSFWRNYHVRFISLYIFRWQRLARWVCKQYLLNMGVSHLSILVYSLLQYVALFEERFNTQDQFLNLISDCNCLSRSVKTHVMRGPETSSNLVHSSATLQDRTHKTLLQNRMTFYAPEKLVKQSKQIWFKVILAFQWPVALVSQDCAPIIIKKHRYDCSVKCSQ